MHLTIRAIVLMLSLSMAALVNANSKYEDLVGLSEQIRGLATPPPVDGVPDFSAAAVNERRQALERYREQLQGFDVAGWPIEKQVDYLVVWSKLNDQLFNHRAMKPWARDALMYLYQVSRVPYAEVPITDEDTQALRAALAAVPRAMNAAQTNLNEAVGELAQLAIFLLENFDGVGQGEPYRDNPPAGTIGWFNDLCQRLQAAQSPLLSDCQAATAAVEGYRDWLKDSLPSMTQSAAIGTDNFNWYLRHVRLLPYTVDDLSYMGEREFHRFRYLYLVDRNKNAKLEELPLTRSAEEHEQRTREAEQQTRRLIADQRLLTIPEGTSESYETDVFWSPRALTDRHFWEEIQFRNALNNHIHASFPGHRFDGELRRSIENPIRRTHSESGRSEGWATYIEELFVQAGIADASPRVRELFYVALIKRGSRFFAEIGMHTGQMSLEEANAYMLEWVPFMEENLGRYDLVGYLRRPGLGSMYLTGKAQIEKLLSERAFQLGEDFHIGEFHDDLLSRGSIPVTLIRWEMAGHDDEVSKIWEEVVGRPFPAQR